MTGDVVREAARAVLRAASKDLRIAEAVTDALMGATVDDCQPEISAYRIVVGPAHSTVVPDKGPGWRTAPGCVVWGLASGRRLVALYRPEGWWSVHLYQREPGIRGCWLVASYPMWERRAEAAFDDGEVDDIR